MSDPSTNYSNPNKKSLLVGLVAAIALTAFFGGYLLGGMNSETLTRDDLAELLEEYEKSSVNKQGAKLPSPLFVSLDDDPMKGNPTATLTIIEFSDFQCPFCARFYHETLPQIEKQYIQTGKVNFVYRDMPLGIHPNAVPAHVAAECANIQGAFWPYHDILFERQSEWNKLNRQDLEQKLVSYAHELGLNPSFDSCLKSSEIVNEVNKDYAQATGYGATGTPTFFIGNSQEGFVKLSGAQPFSAFKNIIDSKLDN